jgi:L-aminopeptidase/D-esterase-like protein
MRPTPSTKPRARDLGIPFEGAPGPLNAITDVRGVEVGMVTRIAETARDGTPAAVRTGITAILPRGKASRTPVFGGWFPLNGNGEMTGTQWLDESGFLEGPILITNTHSVGVVRDAVIRWQLQRGTLYQDFSCPVVAETSDGYLNDMNGFHVMPEHCLQALDTARTGAVAEGNVGGGTGMICYDFKGGTGTASRRLRDEDGGFTVGVLVQANHGDREELLVAGVPVGRLLEPHGPATTSPDRGSIIIVVATDAPLLPHQLRRLAKRAALGLARTGGSAGIGSGDIFIAFSTANPDSAQLTSPTSVVTFVRNGRLDPVFRAVILATEEAIINALVAAETLVGRDGHTASALPHDDLIRILSDYRRLGGV